MKVYTRKGDDGTTGLFHGGRVAKDSPRPTAYGDVDELQAFLGLARAAATGELAEILVGLERDLWLVMAELACNPDRLDLLAESGSLSTPEMVVRLEGLRSEEHTSELQSQAYLVCRLLLEKKNTRCVSHAPLSSFTV